METAETRNGSPLVELPGTRRVAAINSLPPCSLTFVLRPLAHVHVCVWNFREDLGKFRIVPVSQTYTYTPVDGWLYDDHDDGFVLESMWVIAFVWENGVYVVGGRVVFWGLKLRVYYDIIILKYNLVWIVYRIKVRKLCQTVYYRNLQCNIYYFSNYISH